MASYEEKYEEKYEHELAELKRIVEKYEQKIEVYRSLAMLIGSMKACERFIDKEKAFDEIMKHFENNFSATGAVK
jgi:flagellar biosynthesis chaperone FliJ